MRSRPFQLFLGASLLAALTVHLFAPPVWWGTRNVATLQSADDFAVLNQGQLKNFMRGAIEEMNASLPGGAGPELNALLASWRNDTSQADDYAIANQGQLKAMGKLLRGRLAQLNILTPNFGTADTQDDDDHAPSNLGQAKNVFNLPLLNDTDEDGFNDTWELLWFGMLNRDLQLDADGDGVCDADEYLAGTDPMKWQSRPSSGEVAMSVFTQLNH